MDFEALTESVERLRAVLYEATGKDLIENVSLDLPGDDDDEAAFLKLLLWSYVLWFEACQPVGRHLMSIVRNSSPDDQKVAARTFLDIQNLRTFHAHNLRESNAGDQHKINQAKAWLVGNGAAKQNWEACLEKLTSSLIAALNILRAHWGRLMESPEDALAAVQALNEALERNWEPYLFDSIVDEIASTLALTDFDAVKYRNLRLEDWRKAAELFQDRMSAEAALRRMIRQELLAKFGANPG